VTPLQPLERAWLISTFVIGLAFIAAIPPFQTNDEDSHWVHMWGVALGQLRCGGEKPRVVMATVSTLRQAAVHRDPSTWQVRYLLQAAELVGTGRLPGAGTACGYPPLAYVAPGLVARALAFDLHGRVRRYGMLAAIYGARLTNWLVLTLAVWLLCGLQPWSRHLALLVYSIPEVIQQSMAINTDSFILACTVVASLASFRQAGTRAWAMLCLAVTAMTINKPIYAPLSALGLPALTSASALSPRRRTLFAIALFALPIIAYAAWQRFTHPAGTAAATGGAALQMAYLKAHPRVVLSVLRYQVLYLFNDELMKGSWLSIFGAFGWSQFTMARVGYHLLLLALGLAIGADLTSGRRAPPLGADGGSGPLFAWLAAGVGQIITLIAIVIAMYIYFTGGFLGIVGGPDAIGVQGRYYLTPLWLLCTIPLYLINRRSSEAWRLPRGSRYVTALALASTLSADLLALRAIMFTYYHAV
jgi:hypothetical protein